MERSQSCTHFQTTASTAATTTELLETAYFYEINAINNNKNLDHNMSIDQQLTTTATTMHFKAMQQKSVSGSQLNVNQLNTSVATNNNNNNNNNNTYTPSPLSIRRKRKLLQRQQSREYADDDMDYEYAADQEDADADEEDLDLDEDLTTSGEDSLAHTIANETPRAQLPPLLIKKHVQYPRRKPQSAGALLINAFSLPNNCTTPVSMSNPYIDRQRRLKHEDSFDSSSSAGVMSIGSPICSHRHFGLLKRDNSIHSDSSRYSSVDSLLEARKPDPEAILINLGFGPVDSEDILTRIPKRFLKPSQVRGNDTEAFLRRLQLASSIADHSVLGYRGLTGNPDVPPSSIVAKIMRRFEVNERKKSIACAEHTIQ